MVASCRVSVPTSLRSPQSRGAGVIGGVGKTVEIRVETLIAQTAEAVWSFVSDFERLAEWLEEFQAVVKEPTASGSGLRAVALLELLAAPAPAGMVAA
jgi:hypothetical protein